MSDYCVFVILFLVGSSRYVAQCAQLVRFLVLIHHAARAFLRLRFDNNLFSVSLQGQMSCILFCFGVGSVRYVFHVVFV